jgi:thioredoxin 1
MNILLYIVLAFILLFVFAQYKMVRSARKMKGRNITGLKGELKKLEEKGARGLLYFYSPGCHACKNMTPVIKELRNENKNVFDIDAASNIELTAKFGIMATPTTILLESGNIKEIFIGARSKEQLKSLLA